MRWLLVGFTHKEIRERKYRIQENVQYVTLDRGDDAAAVQKDIDFHGDAFDVETWRRVMSVYGPRSFDVIFTDGGMFGIKRVDEILQIKRQLLTANGGVLNFTSPLGHMVPCPFGRPYQYKWIQKNDYTIDIMNQALNALEQNKLSNVLKKGLNILI